MDFDEYDYLEKTVENPELLKVKETANGVDESRKAGDSERSRSSKHRLDDSSQDLEHRSKRIKSGDEMHDPERHRERGSSHRRSSSRDADRSEKDRHRSSREHREKGREKEWEERNGRERYRGRDKRERDHDPGRSRDRREQDHESEREREKGRRERGRDIGREEGRGMERDRSHRSASRSERHHSRDDRDLEKSRDMEFKVKEKVKEFGERDREIRRHKEKKEDAPEPEADPERDQRTVFAYQICLKADERDVYEFFSRAGKVRDVRLIMDRNSRRSKGVGYIEFYDAMSVPMAIALSGQPLLSQPVMVKPSEAEKNLVQSTTTASAGPAGLIGPYAGAARKLYVGNLHFNITEDQLRQVFEPFGAVELVQLPLDQETGHCKGFGFVQFARIDDAKAALSLNGLEIAGRAIKLSAVTDQAGMQDLGANAADFDDDEGGGLALNARSRALLMQKLDRAGTASSFSGSSAPVLGAVPVGSALVPPGVQASVPSLAGLPSSGLSIPTTVPTVDVIGIPSECLLLKNMFDPSLEREPDFDVDIKEDVEDECKKFGRLRHIHVEKESAGFVYLLFEDIQSAVNAQRALHGRWFAGKMITATYMLPQSYRSKFPDS